MYCRHYSCTVHIGGSAAQADWLGSTVGSHLVQWRCYELGALKRLCHDDCTINIILSITIIISITVVVKCIMRHVM